MDKKFPFLVEVVSCKKRKELTQGKQQKQQQQKTCDKEQFFC